MNSPITNFLKILADNNYQKKSFTNIEDIDIIPFTEDDIPEGLESNMIAEEAPDSDSPEGVVYNEEYVSDSLDYYELNGYKDYEELEEYLYEEFKEFKIDFIINSFEKNSDLIAEVINQINDIKEDLNHLHQFYSAMFKDAGFNALIRTKSNVCDEVISFLSNQTNKTKSVKANPSNNPHKMKQKEIVILFHHLRFLGLIDSIPNNVYAQYISDLTGYSMEKIRQDLSHIHPDSTSTDKLRIQQSDYEGINRVLEKKLLPSIKKEMVK